MPEPQSQEEVARHNVTHVPYKAWCKLCVMSKAADLPHLSVDRRDGTGHPLVEADYMFFSTDIQNDTQQTGQIGLSSVNLYGVGVV